MTEHGEFEGKSVVIDLPAEGKILCPVPDCQGEVVEQDIGFRWNRIYVENDTVYITQDSGDWDGNGFLCDVCSVSIDFTVDVHDLIDYS
jgi:hypothetical protein